MKPVHQHAATQAAIIVGAGASLAEALSHRPARHREHPPLDTHFFSKCREVGLQRDLHILQDYARFAGLADPLGQPEPRMEEFFGQLYYEVRQDGGLATAPSMGAYRLLLGLYNRVLARTTNWMRNRSDGVVGHYLRKVVTTPSLAKLTLITFNHDLVLENQLTMLPWRQRWCLDKGYGPVLLTPGRPMRGAENELPRHSEQCTHDPHIELLKLHGSLNWQVVTQSHTPRYSDLFPSVGSTKTMHCVTNRNAYVRIVRHTRRRKYHMWPQIVPPIYEKGGLIGARFDALWRHAERALTTADWVAFIGYSHPAADIHASAMMRRALSRNKMLRALDVVNPNPAVVDTLATLAPMPSMTWYRNLATYIGSI